MENPKKQLIDKLKDANNVLVTVSSNPTVDQLCAAIGLTLFLTKLKKHATTVFSGEVPTTIDFLKPEDTIETNTDSLRDFIISLDKSKADKIRYKVEDTMVKIFITPYRSSITDEDLIFSQGDFNVDVVVGLGVQVRDDIDQAIMANGRILHDATVATVNVNEKSDLGTLNWSDADASSLCEMIVGVTDQLKANSLDGQMATALLTGIVSETDRFSNDKTTSNTMNASAKLMAAGANQQLVATQLETVDEISSKAVDEFTESSDDSSQKSSKNAVDSYTDDDGSLKINHKENHDDHTEDNNTKDSEPVVPWSPELDLPEVPEAKDDEAFDKKNVVKELSVDNLLDDNSHKTEKVLNEETENQADQARHAEIQPENKKSVEQPLLTDKLGANGSDSYSESNPFNFPEIKRPLLRRDTEKPALDDKASEEKETTSKPKKDDAKNEATTKESDSAVENFLKHRINRRHENNTFDNKVIPDSEKQNSEDLVNEEKAFVPKPLDKDLAPKLDAIKTAAENPKKINNSKNIEGETSAEEISHEQKSVQNVSKLPESFIKTLNKSSLEAIEKRVGAKKEPEITTEEENTSQQPMQEKAYKPVIDDVTNKSIDQIERAMADLKKKQYDEKTTTTTLNNERMQDSNSQAAEKQESDTAKLQDEARDAVMKAINTMGDRSASLPAEHTANLVDALADGDKESDGNVTPAPDVPPPIPASAGHKGPSPYIDIDSQTGVLTPLSPDSVTSESNGSDGSALTSTPPMVPPPISTNSNV